MDKLTHYREIIRRELEEFARWSNPEPTTIRSEVVYDPVLDHFALIECGWEEHRRVHIVLFHIDIIGDKVWIQHDATDRPIATELIRAGIPRSDIVLGFHPPEVRQHTEFAVG